MGLTKQYLRYAASAVFGVIGSQKANIAYVTLRGGEKGRYVAVAACEHVFIWDARKAEKVSATPGICWVSLDIFYMLISSFLGRNKNVEQGSSISIRSLI